MYVLISYSSLLIRIHENSVISTASLRKYFPAVGPAVHASIFWNDHIVLLQVQIGLEDNECQRTFRKASPGDISWVSWALTVNTIPWDISSLECTYRLSGLQPAICFPFASPHFGRPHFIRADAYVRNQ